MADPFSQVYFKGASDCKEWKPNAFRKTNCVNCSSVLTDHQKENITKEQLEKYLDAVSGENPMHKILESQSGLGGLFLGSRMAVSEKHINSGKITHLAQTAGGLEKFYPPWGRRLDEFEKKEILVIFRLGWIDSPDCDILSNLKEGVLFIHEARKKGGGVLVNCAQGKSRSSSLVVAYLMANQKMSVSEAVKFTQKKRSIAEPNPGFLDQLKEFETSSLLQELRDVCV